MSNEFKILRRDENQARALGQYAVDFLGGRFPEPDQAVYDRLERFHLDSIACAVSALACGARAPTLLREEALEYAVDRGSGATCFGSAVGVYSWMRCSPVL